MTQVSLANNRVCSHYESAGSCSNVGVPVCHLPLSQAVSARAWEANNNECVSVSVSNHVQLVLMDQIQSSLIRGSTLYEAN